MYTLPGYRGRGMAAELFARARRDFRDVEHADENDLSSAGRGWRDKMERFDRPASPFGSAADRGSPAGGRPASPFGSAADRGSPAGGRPASPFGSAADRGSPAGGDAPRKPAGRRRVSLRVTAADLIRAIYGEDVAYANLGVYPGTSTPIRNIRGDETLSVEGTSAGARVTDGDGGWIADRVGNMGARQVSKLLAFLGK
jgi:hypothetical protein